MYHDTYGFIFNPHIFLFLQKPRKLMFVFHLPKFTRFSRGECNDFACGLFVHIPRWV